MPTWSSHISDPTLLAALAQASDAVPWQSTAGFGWVLVKTALILGAVCLLAYLVLRVGLPRLGAGRRPGAGRLAVLDRLSLDPRRSVQVVRVGAKVLLLGVGDGGIRLLSELDPEEWVTADTRAPSTGFTRALARALGAGADAPPRGTSDATSGAPADGGGRP